MLSSREELVSVQLTALHRKFRLASFNARTMSPDGSVLACALWAKQQQVSILCIQETHIPFDEDYEIGSGWRFINFASKDGIGGVGALLSPDASRRLVAATGTHRHIVLNLRILTIVGVYAPTAQSPDEME